MGFRGGDISHFFAELRQFGLVIIGYIAVIVLLILVEWLKIKKQDKKNKTDELPIS